MFKKCLKKNCLKPVYIFLLKTTHAEAKCVVNVIRFIKNLYYFISIILH